MRTVIIVDGSNFYFKLKDLELHNLLQFNFNEFAQFLSGSDHLVESCYYIGRIRQDDTKKTEKLFTGQQQLIASLKKSNWRYSFGYLLKNDGRYHEKGVDVQMATDILVAAYEDKCDKIILVSSDTDLAPAIKKVREKNKAIEYIGFSHQPSIAMVSFCSSSRLLTKVGVERFIVQNLEPRASNSRDEVFPPSGGRTQVRNKKKPRPLGRGSFILLEKKSPANVSPKKP